MARSRTPRNGPSGAGPRPGSRRRFLKGATAATGAAAIAGLAACGRGEQGKAPAAGTAPSAAPQVTLRMQASTAAGDIFFVTAQDYARIVKDLTGGGVSIEVLPVGVAVTPSCAIHVASWMRSPWRLTANMASSSPASSSSPAPVSGR